MLASDAAYASLREDIVSGRLGPGTVLGEVEQAARLGVSRTPLREALARLAAEGLAVAGKGRTLVVSNLSAEDVRHLFELREALECQAARLAAQRGDRTVFARLAERFAGAAALVSATDPDQVAYYGLVAELDAALDEAMASPYLLRSLATLRTHVARARRLAHDNPERLAQAAHEHRLIAEAIAEGDATLAAQATAVHLRASLANILASLAAAGPGDPAGPHDPADPHEPADDGEPAGPHDPADEVGHPHPGAAA
ncbi:GntR family transcriptional regulator [Georgenia thermotolerans]|uniref:FCD domain-containing protein n=1 Tax=Georgenia thermotolerans TaxID=527326 RepID=A0A7J5UTS3_9MICO|nr:GntR family transcriptional regulator [Georgenia thermotolerans]KAE8765694.1 FCD domain-containing protein [Georgenia thermotolerans]